MVKLNECQHLDCLAENMHAVVLLMNYILCTSFFWEEGKAQPVKQPLRGCGSFSNSGALIPSKRVRQASRAASRGSSNELGPSGPSQNPYGFEYKGIGINVIHKSVPTPFLPTSYEYVIISA